MERQDMQRLLERQVICSQQALTKFKEKFEADPFYALSWLDQRTFVEAAKVTLYKEIIELLNTDSSLAKVKDVILTLILNGAQHPSFSTSPGANLADQAKLQAAADLYELLNLGEI